MFPELGYNLLQRSTFYNMGWNEYFSFFFLNAGFKAIFNQMQMNPLSSSGRITSNIELLHVVAKFVSPF